ncbi:putative CmcJ-like methyltransferase [Eremomyces bilateralis CBS 781.70]|uniref:CmcJ-like methyltransferase n=1 Tax=Eremomyces bilateralis CBS 781.70 TaxID=1392243 RepID=A0A6G1GB29_9PEZI|nr:putative CmcJ-like methyltransferase [Eremomyces bilateralis CBS 781.70]KAF1815307.1 putative CmcJ-like methyltransferase [Eremomyces bilateralis CBS 781.70]
MATEAIVPLNVLTELTFLEPDIIFQSEKPYRLRYDPGDEIPRTNCKSQVQSNILIHDIRGRESSFSLDNNGFEILTLDSKLGPEDFYDREKVQAVYYKELQQLLRDRFGPKRVEILEHGIRRRHAEFPISIGGDYDHLQPTSIIHIGLSPWLNGEQNPLLTCLTCSSITIGSLRLTSSSIWKPLRGPLTDWPLSVCDARSVSIEQDCEATDVVERTGFTENYQVYFNPAQHFCYLNRQLASELVVFRQSDTKPGCTTAGSPHAGFRNPNTMPGEHPRESIETRAFLYY